MCLKSSQSSVARGRGLPAACIVLLAAASIAPAAPPDVAVEAVDVNEGADNGNPSDPIVWDGQLFFSAHDGFGCSPLPGGGPGDELGEYGRELFTAGVGTGPILVRDINDQTSGNCDGVSSTLHNNAAGLSGYLIFEARDNPLSSDSKGFEPWRTQGSDTSTEILADIWPDGGDSDPYRLATVLGGSHVVFAADHPSWGVEPWITSGTQAGTVLLENLVTDDGDSDPRAFTPLDGSSFVFVAEDEAGGGEALFASGGAGASLVTNTNPGTFSGSDIAALTTFDGLSKAVFFATDPTAGSEPWVTDGTAVGTMRLADINSGSGSSNPFANDDVPVFIQVGNRMFFVADDAGATGSELWITDGTPAGTRMVADVNPGSGNGFFGHGAAFQGLLYFGGWPGGLWRSDGTAAGTQEVLGGLSRTPSKLTVVGDLLYFVAGTELWVSDGTATGTILVESFARSPRGLAAVGAGVLAFVGDQAATGEEIFLATGVDATGPAIAIGFGPDPVGAGEEGVLTATANDTNTGGSTIAGIEYRLDGGAWLPMPPIDGAYDSVMETGAETVVFMTVGTHEACVRGTDAAGNTGEVNCLDVEVIEGDTTAPLVTTVAIAPDPVFVGEVAVLDATASDVTTGGSRIAVIQYQLDGGDWESVLTPVDGLYDEPTEEIQVDLTFDTGGMHTVCVRALDDPNNLSGPSCVDIQVEVPDATVRLRAIEVNQAIQTWHNDVPLYHDKPTVVRVFLESIDASSPPIATGRLHGSVGGSPLAGSPLAPDRTWIDLVPDATVVDDPDTSGTDESVRALLDVSLNFVLPSSWTDPTIDPVVLEFEVTGPGDQYLECAEPDGSPDCMVGVEFEDVPRPQMAMVAVPYARNEIRELQVAATGGSYILSSDGRDSDPIQFDDDAQAVEDEVRDVLNASDSRVDVRGGGGTGTRTFTIRTMRGQPEDLSVDDSGLSGSATLTTIQSGGPEIRPTDDHLREQARRISDVLPVSSVDRRLTDINGFNRAPNVIKVNTRLQRARTLGLVFGDYVRDAKSFGYMLGRFPGSTRSGQAWVKVASAYSVGTEDPTDGDRWRNIGVHEATHSFGRAHAVTRTDPTGLFRSGVCGAHGHIHLPTLHPWVEDTGWPNGDGTDFYSGTEWPTIGPLSDGPDDEVWGFSPRAYANGAGFENLVVVDPWRTAALMSYCDAPGRRRQDLWVSALTYDVLAQRIHEDLHGPSPGGGGGSDEYVIVAGEIDPVTGDAILEPVLRATGADPGFDPGDVHVALVDGGGAEIAARDVALLEDGNDASLSYGTGPLGQGFVAAVPVPAGATPAGVEVSLDGAPIGSVAGSPNSPSVVLSSPTGGAVVSGPIPIAWTASDADGDDLTATVLYSIDGGATWEALAIDVEGASYDAPARFLRGSTQARIRVQVSDGFHTAEATSSLFTVDAGDPLPSIEVPVRGTAIVCDRPLRLRGDAWDPEEGELDGAALEWSSDRDGVLGTGREVWIDAASLAVGSHVVTLTATDADGRTGTDTVDIHVEPTGCLGGGIFGNGFESGDLSAWSTVEP